MFNDNNQASVAKYALENAEEGKLVEKLLKYLHYYEPKLGQWPVEEHKEWNSGQQENAKNKIDAKYFQGVDLMGSDD